MKSSNIARTIAMLAAAILPPLGVFRLTSGYVLPNHKKRRNRRGTGKYRTPNATKGRKYMQLREETSRRGLDGTMRL